MTDRPIIFSAPMVKAMIAGRKTQTRRLLKKGCPASRNLILPDGPNKGGVQMSYAPGDRLYVREAHRCNGWASDVATIFYRASEGDGYTAMCEQWPVADHKPMPVSGKWRSPIHMPRWASRLTLTVTDVRVERLNEISEADAIAEGGLRNPGPTEYGDYFSSEVPESFGDQDWGSAREWFADLWNTIHGPSAWDDNPWVVAISFDVRHGNIDMAAPAVQVPA